jgi:hypothetical protein
MNFDWQDPLFMFGWVAVAGVLIWMAALVARRGR